MCSLVSKWCPLILEEWRTSRSPMTPPQSLSSMMPSAQRRPFWTACQHAHVSQFLLWQEPETKEAPAAEEKKTITSDDEDWLWYSIVPKIVVMCSWFRFYLQTCARTTGHRTTRTIGFTMKTLRPVNSTVQLWNCLCSVPVSHIGWLLMWVAPPSWLKSAGNPFERLGKHDGKFH